MFVVGGGNSAGQAVMNLSAYAKRVTMLVRGPSLSATLSAYLEERVVRQPNVEIRTNTRVAGLRGAQGLTSIRLEDTRTGAVRRNSVKRVASAVGEGAMAVTFVHSYLAST
ncbi:NAD(P)/FAD-dependent oxidoreductase [Gordonia alkanivorans]|uniref:NAD(P)/FAD-dependent oxidoreductase n=1 Tax=Gordonia alkanivorans TaxID=84096 RepID=UPI001F4D8D86|nr:NAD-binding protein [Gordonia alkanivorans]